MEPTRKDRTATHFKSGVRAWTDRRLGSETSKSGACSGGYAGPTVDFPNLCRKESETMAWTLLHQCTLEKWKDGHADASGFSETLLTCNGVIHKDCSLSFCMSRQGIININKGPSLFSFRKRSRFAKMAEHFEYNHIPAQMSSINHFRVKSVLCFRDCLVVLHLSRNTNSQFGLLDLGANKFLGVFGKQHLEFANETLAGELSPDRSKCLVRIPSTAAQGEAAASVLHLYDLRTKTLVAEIDLDRPSCYFCFDPRFTWRRIAATNFGPGRRDNSLSLVELDAWSVLSTNEHAGDSRQTLLRDLCYSHDGSLLVATVLDADCLCREKKTRNYRPIGCSVCVFSGDSAEALHCVRYRRFACATHNCPVNYRPVFSACGSRMGVVADQTDSASQHSVQVYKMPTAHTLQGMCRVVILRNYAPTRLSDLPLPPKLIAYLRFKPDFD